MLHVPCEVIPVINNTTGSSNASEGALINLNANEQTTVLNVSQPLANLPPVPPRSFENKNGLSNAYVKLPRLFVLRFSHCIKALFCLFVAFQECDHYGHHNGQLGE